MQVGLSAPPIAQALLAVQQDHQVEEALATARRDVGNSINANQYSRSYDPILQLHLLHEVEMIHRTNATILRTKDPVNHRAITQQHVRDLVRSLDERFLITSPSFRVREAILAIRRTAFALVDAPQLKAQIGQAWIQSSKIARKAAYEQTAYSATLQAKEADAPFAFLQQAKLLHSHGGVFKALTDLENTVTPMLRSSVIDLTDEGFLRDRYLSKVCLCGNGSGTDQQAVLLEARWAHETDRFERNQIIERYRKAIDLAPRYVDMPNGS